MSRRERWAHSWMLPAPPTLWQQTLWSGSQCPIAHGKGSGACVSLVKDLDGRKSTSSASPGAARAGHRGSSGAGGPVPTRTIEPTPGCHFKKLRSLPWALLSLPSLGIPQSPRLVSFQKVWLGATASGMTNLGPALWGRGLGGGSHMNLVFVASRFS